MHTVISTWTDIIQQFFPIFTTPGAKIFSDLMTGWILCTARRTITDIIPFADPYFQHAHDAYHRFFPNTRWDTSRLWKILTLILVKLFSPTGIITIALDNTLFHHSGRKVNGAGYWRDAVRSTKKNIVYA
ncbi:MAG: transposase [Sedimentisphaerales bacterium]|nr:transposase [Sedimentisphaerales bacterium]